MRKVLCIITTAAFALFYLLPAAAQSNEIPNSDFEYWSGDRPDGFGAFQAPKSAYKDLQTVFQSNDAHNGKHSVRLRNGSLHEYLKKNPIPTTYKPPEIIFPAGIWTCAGDCRIPPKGMEGFKKAQFKVSKRYKTLCGYYKGTLSGGDKLFISISMFKGNNVMGGSDAGTIQHAFITQSSNGWKKFEIPITYLPGNDKEIPDGASLQISIAGRSFPQNPMGISGTFGSEILIDDLSFCTGKADILVFLPKVMNEESPDTPAPANDEQEPPVNTQVSGAGSNLQLSKEQQLIPGVQTFVNLDNDDTDEFFDFNPEEEQASDKKVEKGDDELIMIKLRIPENEAKNASRKMEASLTITEGPGHIRLYDKETKEGRITLPKTFDVLNEFKERDGEFLVKQIWIEGILPHTKQQGTKLSFTHSEDASFEEKFGITIIGIKSIEWIGKKNSIKSDNHLDEDPNFINPDSTELKPGALRVFPGKRMENVRLDKEPRNKVDVKVTLTVKPAMPVKIFFDSHDVDDPTAAGKKSTTGDPTDSENWIDNEEERYDNRGAVGTSANRQAGKFPDEKPDGILEIEFAEAEMIFPFEVTMQPGDNFRITGSCDKDFLRSLRNDESLLAKGAGAKEQNENKQRIVNRFVLNANKEDVKKAEIREADKYASKVLTVWRFLYGEVDHMDAIGEDKITGKVISVERNNPANGKTKLTIDNIIDNLATITTVSTWMGRNGIKDCFHEGAIEIILPTGSIKYTVAGNSANEAGNDFVVVEGLVPDEAVMSVYFLQDDDEAIGFKKGDRLENITMIGDRKRNSIFEESGFSLIADRYAQAYVVPDFKTLSDPAVNKEPISKPFLRNLDVYETEAQDINLTNNYRYDLDKIGYNDKEDFWAVYILFAYKGATYEDGDADGFVNGAAVGGIETDRPISGLTDKKKIGLHVFLEGNVERNAGRYFNATRTGKGEKDCIVHEIAHLFGGEHEDGGLMASPDPTSYFFSRRTLGKIRTCKHP